jgi:hypothetical protein
MSITRPFQIGTSFRRLIILVALLLVGCSLLFSGLITFENYVSVAPWSTGVLGLGLYLWLVIATLVAMLLWMVTFLCLFVALVGLFFRRTRRLAVVAVIGVLFYLLSIPASMDLGYKLKMNELRGRIDRSQPLIEAIQAYEERNGTPPPSLEALVPEFLAGIPDTGIGLSPEYEYIVGGKAMSLYHNNRWVLQVVVPGFGVDSEVLLYYPKQNYPTYGRFGRFKQVEDWAIVYQE